MELTKIGKGTFTNAFINQNNKVILSSVCPIKEIMAANWFPDSDLFPVINWLDTNIYEMEYYPKVRSLKKSLDSDQWALYKTLRLIAQKQLDNICTIKNINNLFYKLHDLFDLYLDGEIQEDLKYALDACANYSSQIVFEISPRNVAVKNGKLILLDVFYAIDYLKKARNKTIKPYTKTEILRELSN